MSVVLGLYRGLTAVAEPFAPYVLNARLRRGKEDPARLNERLGRPKLPCPEGEVIWMHGASVGETLSLLPLVDAFLKARPAATVLMTSGTRTSAEVMATRLPGGAIHQYIPVDTPGAARRFIEHWRPALGVFVESELWPNLLSAAHEHGVKLALVSARLGEASAQGWGRSPAAARVLFSRFDLILPQDDDQAARLTTLGARDDGRLNLKFLGDPLPVDDAALSQARVALGERPLLLAASTHLGEDEIVLAAFEGVAHHPLRPLLVIAPRHPVRGPSIAGYAQATGLDVSLRSAGQPIASAQVHVADTLNEMGLWFRLARLALIGGSLVDDVGGHNPLEAIRLGCPALSGPFVDDWRSVYAPLVAAHDVGVVASSDQLEGQFSRALDGKDAATADAALKLIAEKSDLAPAFAKLQALLP
ncbi:MAG TPA: glycosyltransferase N-terminal domain-containing protein [Caulobacteraceae bacterium]